MKKLLTSLLCVVMVVCFMPSMAWADAATLPSATDNKVVLTENVNSTGDITVASGETLTIDLSGKTLNLGQFTLKNEGTLIIQDSVGNGKITSTKVKGGETAGTITNSGSLTIEAGIIDAEGHGTAPLFNAVNGTMEIKGGEILRSKEDPNNTSDSAGNNSYYAILNHGNQITIYPGVTVTQNGHFSSMIANGWYNGNNKPTGAPNSKLIIKGGVFSGGLNTVKNDDWGELEIEDGTFTNVSQTVIQNHNIAKLSGGTYNQEGNAINVIENNNHGYDGDAGKLEINGGTYNGEIVSVVASGHTVDISVTEGTFSSNVAEYVHGDETSVALTSGTKTTYYVGTPGDVATIIKDNAKDGDSVAVQKGNLTLDDIDKTIEVETVEENKYVVSFDNEGTKTCQVVAKDSQVQEPADPTKSGYTFNGWYKEDGTAYNFDTEKVTDHITLTAKWSKNVYIPPTPTTQTPTIEADENATVTLSDYGTKATIKVADGYELVDVTVNGVSKGKVDTLTSLKTGDKVVVTTKKIETPVDPAAEAAGVENTTLKIYSKKGNGWIKISWVKSEGFEVDGYELYRGKTKSSMKKYDTTKKTSYKNAKYLKKGNRYYYKVRGYRMVGGEKVYTKWSKTIYRIAI